MGNKVCSICKLDKPISDYYNNRKGYYSYCKSCTNKKSRKWAKNNKDKVRTNKKKYYTENRESVRERDATYRTDYRDKVFNHYGWECKCCGEKEILFLTIDHINNDGKNHLMKSGRRYSGTALYRFLILNNFPVDFQTLCMQCNWGKRMNNGICPHKNKI